MHMIFNAYDLLPPALSMYYYAKNHGSTLHDMWYVLLGHELYLVIALLNKILWHDVYILFGQIVLR